MKNPFQNPNDKKGNKDQNQPGGQNGPGKNPDNNEFQWKKASKTMFMWIIIIIVSLILFSMFNSTNKEAALIWYSPHFLDELQSGNISEGTIVGREFRGKLKEPKSFFVDGRETPAVDNFVMTLPPTFDYEMLKTWEAQGIKYKFEKETTTFSTILINMLPWVLIIAVWIFLIRRMQGQNNKGVFGFGKSRAKLWTSDRPQTTFQDVAGCQEAKEELQEVIEFLKNPKKFSKLGGKIPKGALLLGPPGTGKTLLAKAVAGEAGVPFFSISGADFVEMFVGVGASRVRDLFDQGKKNAPCIVFIDEIDAVGRHRGAGLGGGHDEREQTLNQLLVEMDGFDENTNIIIIAATNRPDVLDNALLRPGRFDRQIVVDAPDVKGREGILRVHTKKIPLAKDVTLNTIAKGTPGLVGADLANLVNEAALLAARKDKSAVDMNDFEDAKDKVMMGTERRSMVISDKEKELTAYHEAGHALVAMELPEADPIHKVTIVPRGRALGVTHQLPMDERHNYSKKYIEARLAILLGGRAAEQIVFDELSTGAGNDIERATEMARKMVCEWGMSTTLGPLTFGKKQEEVFLGREIAQHRDYSEETARTIDAEVRSIIESAETLAKEILQKKRKELDDVADNLLKYEILEGDEIKQILEGKPLEKIVENGDSKKQLAADNSEEDEAKGQVIDIKDDEQEAEEKPEETAPDETSEEDSAQTTEE